jgi:deoxyadenosine/deoxycytidine kinase
MRKFIIVAGNIGVGKSTLVTLLSRKLGWAPFFEPVVENPYLTDFYQDMNAWGFQSQVFFLAQRLLLHQQVLRCPQPVIMDRSIYEDAEIFAGNLHRQGKISPRDFDTYATLYRALVDFLPPPDLLIYLRASVDTLLTRIHHRNRPYELSISPDYLAQLNDLYETWVQGFTYCPVLIVPADALDYELHSAHLDLVARKIEEKFTGNEEVVFSAEDLAHT